MFLILSFRSIVPSFHRSIVPSFYRPVVLSFYRLFALCPPTTCSLFYPGVFLHLIIQLSLMLNPTPFANIDCSPVLIQN